MNRQIDATLSEVDLVVMVAEARKWTKEDDSVAALVRESGRPAFLVLNKHDQLKHKSDLLPRIEAANALGLFEEIIPAQATNGDNLQRLIDMLSQQAPEREFVFTDDEFTDRSQRFLAAEIIREKLNFIFF